MSDLAQRLAKLSPAQRALLERRLETTRKPAAEPIAIIGMACRFPGAPTLEAYWDLIQAGRSAAREVPPDRWNVDDFYDPTGEVAGKMSVRWAALVDSPGDFDPQFFGITPREAARMDPQQRLLLEVAWEAMENAGRPADQLAGSRTGVFVGIGGTDYSKVCVPYDDYFQQIDAHMGTGNALSIAANRLSYIFDFHGPSAAIDTACSSSSLAIHFAVESLRRGESDSALAGGVNMILTPETTIAFAKARMLSPDGVCRPFDSRANGYVRGEGCGVVLLKRLSDAQRDGDNILAVLRASSVNQDGRTSGISAPNSQSQLACIRAALEQAGLMPAEISCIEAHGTGTPLGDPIEMQALCEIFRETDPGAKPCYIASVKANVGHMETVSGTAGLIKVLLMMQHGEIARQANFESLNAHIQLKGTRLAIPTEAIAWSGGDRPRIAGVSSFGFGGTNTHLIVEAADQAITQGAPGDPRSRTRVDNQVVASRDSQVSIRPVHLLKLSGKSTAVVAQQAERLAEYLEKHSDADFADVCWTSNTGRADFNYRAAITATDTAHLREQLRKLASGEAASAAVKQGTLRALGRPKVAFLFTGQGLQYVGMGRGLYESHPVFRDALGHCDEILRPCWEGRSLIEILFPADKATDDPAAQVHQTAYTQPALLALEYALAELWRSWGVEPDIVLGHSVGEYAAACVAGVMRVEDGLALIAERAQLMQAVERHGKMAVVFASHDRVKKELDTSDGRVVIGVINGPENIVISGEAAAVDRLAEKFTADGIQVKMLNVSHAFHSPLMDEMLDEFERIASRIEFRTPRIPLAANLTGQLMTSAPTARYWRDHLRNTVQFAEGMARIAESKPTMLIEIGPTPSLLSMGRRCVPSLDAAWLPSLRAGQDDWKVLASSVAEYYVRGGQIDWRGWDKPWPRRRLMLPTYPFQRTRHWFNLDSTRRRIFANDGETGVLAAGPLVHQLLGARLSTVWSNMLFEARISARSPAFLADHRVQGSPVTPAAAYIEQGLAAAEQQFGEGRHGLENLLIQQAMFLPEGTQRRVQISLSPESGGESKYEVYGQPADVAAAATAWTMHAAGTLVHESKRASAVAGNSPRGGIDIDEVQGRAVGVTSRDDFYQRMSERGLAYGPTFQVLDELCQCVDDALARVNLPESVLREANRYHLHPALGDALLQSMAGAVPLEKDGLFSPYTYMPVGIRCVSVVRSIDDYSRPMFTYAVRTSADDSPSPERVEGDVYLLDESGKTLVAFSGVQVQRLGRSAAGGAEQIDISRWIYRVAWHESPLTNDQAAQGSDKSAVPAASGAWLIFSDSRGVGRSLAERLAVQGQASVLVEPAAAFRWSPGDSGNGKPGNSARAELDPLDETHYRELFAKAFGTPGKTCRGVVHLWSLDIRESGPSVVDDSDRDRIQTDRRLGCGSVTQLIRALSRANLPAAPVMWIVTSGAQAVDYSNDVATTPISVHQSPILGLGRVAAMELPDLKPRLVDLDSSVVADNSDAVAVQIVDELRSNSSEGEVAYRNNKRYVSRLVRDPSIVKSAAEDSSSFAVPAGRPFQLRITQAGSLDALRLVPVDREPPAAGQVEIEVHAAGLNFSDVLKALGLYPGIKDKIVPLGIEASGVVTAVGEGGGRFRVGDQVFGVVPYAFASHARTAEYALVHKPAAIYHDQACTIPITFLTAYYGLVHLARLQPGERVLIHAGAGGVGLAAIQIAQHIGAEVFATAGSVVKRDFLQSLGVEHVYNSRDLAFADEILADTNRAGVDVVLNSLPGEAITKSLSILRAYGRFLEIGKTDIYQNRMIGLLPFQDNLSYFAIDLDRMLRQRPEAIREFFAEVMRHFEEGHYRPLMFTRFETEKTVDAFRYMQQRKNVGKVVVAIEGRGARSEEREPESKGKSAIARCDGTYLITGGTGALGLQVAEWLAEKGAGVIALLSRRGATPQIERSLASIREQGAEVVVLNGDVADPGSLATALQSLPTNSPPLRGVVHAAGVLADGVLTEMTLEQLDRALLPKVNGAWNLHLATLEQPLDFFVLFSSVASVLGSPGQANYAAGNSFLDALAHARRSQGLPATAINWGPWAGSGMAAEAGRDQAVKSRGMALIEPGHGLEVLGQLLRAEAAQAAVIDANWDDLLRLLGTRRPALLAEIAAENQQASSTETISHVDHAFRQRLLAADAITRQSLVCEYIRDELARIMGIEPANLEIDQPLATFGLDSLLALELKNNLEGRLDFTLPMAKLMEGPSIASLAEETVRLVAGSEPASLTEAASEEWVPLLALQASGTRPPLVLLPALGGDIRCYADLVQQLDEDQPVYAFRPRGADQELPPHQSMDEMISDYATALRKLQPQGPYHLAGWSTGGIFAVALAAALERAGDVVATLALFDTPLPSICHNVDLDDDARFLCDLVNFANRFAGTNVRIDYGEISALPRDERFPSALAKARRQGTVPEETPESIIRRLVHVGEANVRVIQGYMPAALNAQICLFVPEIKGGLAEVSGQDVPEVEDHGWSNVIGQPIELHTVPGDHFTMMVGQDAAPLAGWLAKLMSAPAAAQRREHEPAR